MVLVLSLKLIYLLLLQKPEYKDYLHNSGQQNQSRFSRLLESRRIQPAENLSEEIIYDIIKNALALGLLQETGKDETENPIVIPGKIFEEKQPP